jgi:hypothetical protein
MSDTDTPHFHHDHHDPGVAVLRLTLAALRIDPDDTDHTSVPDDVDVPAIISKFLACPECMMRLVFVFAAQHADFLADYHSGREAAAAHVETALAAALDQTAAEVGNDRVKEFRAKFEALTDRYKLCSVHDHGHGPAEVALLDAIEEREIYMPEVGQNVLPVTQLAAADIDLLIELCDRVAIAKGKRWNAQFELRAAKGPR